MNKYLINNNNLGNLKVFNDSGKCIAKIKHIPLSSKYTLVNSNEQFIFRIDEVDVLKHKFEVSFTEYGNDVQLEIAKKSNFNIGFGLGHLVLLPLASIPFGSYYGVSKKGDIYVKKSGKQHNICIGNSVIGMITIKKGNIFVSDKTSLEVYTNDTALNLYALSIYIIMILNDYFK